MYELMYSPVNGIVSCIKRLLDNAFIPICEGNMDYQDFLKWNEAQPEDKQLDLNSTIEPVKPVPPRDLGKEVDELKDEIKAYTLLIDEKNGDKPKK